MKILLSIVILLVFISNIYGQGTTMRCEGSYSSVKTCISQGASFRTISKAYIEIGPEVPQYPDFDLFSAFQQSRYPKLLSLIFTIENFQGSEKQLGKFLGSLNEITQISNLTLEFPNNDFYTIKPFETNPFDNMYNLRNLKIDLSYNQINNFEPLQNNIQKNDKLYGLLLNFIEQDAIATTIDFLTVMITDRPEINNFQVLFDSVHEMKNFEFLEPVTKFNELNRFVFYIDNRNFSLEDISYLTTIFTEQTKIETLELDFGQNSVKNFWPLESLIKIENLRELTIVARNVGQYSGFESFDPFLNVFNGSKIKQITLEIQSENLVNVQALQSMFQQATYLRRLSLIFSVQSLKDITPLNTAFYGLPNLKEVLFRFFGIIDFTPINDALFPLFDKLDILEFYTENLYGQKVFYDYQKSMYKKNKRVFVNNDTQTIEVLKCKKKNIDSPCQDCQTQKNCACVGNRTGEQCQQCLPNMDLFVTFDDLMYCQNEQTYLYE